MRNNTKKFFDEISQNYHQRYTDKDKRSLFFNERLNFSLKEEDLKGKSIIDIGAGNGMIYHKTKHLNVNYYACDISEKMMRNGGIPKKMRYLIKKDFPEELYKKKYDYIFVLGLTAYLSREEFQNYIKIIENCSKAGSRIIISYTLNNLIHKTITNLSRIIYKKIFIKFYKINNILIASNINIKRSNLSDCFKISRNLLIYDYLFHNFVPAPLDRLLPYTFLKATNILLNKIFGNNRLKHLATDLIIKYHYVP